MNDAVNDAASGALKTSSVTTERAVRSGVALATGVATFVPIPFLGDWLVARSRRHLVERLLRRHERSYPATAIKPFYDEGWGALWLLPIRFVRGLVLAPIKRLLRTIFLVLGIRDVILTMGLTLAMAHVLDRMLKTGSLRDDDDPKQRRAFAERLRKATATAYGGVDHRLVRAALTSIGKTVSRSTLSVVDVSDHGGVIDAFLSDLDDRLDKALLAD